MIINVDSDGVVYDFIGIVQRRLERWLDRKLETPTSWQVENTWGITREDVVFHFEREAKHGVFQFGSPIPGAIDGLKALIDKGHQVRIVTNKAGMGRGTRAAIQDTAHWYGLKGLLGDLDLVFTRGYDKQAYPADVVIDDQPNLTWIQKNAANILFDQPWNQNLAVIPEGMWIRAADWDVVLELVDIETFHKEALVVPV